MSTKLLLFACGMMLFVSSSAQQFGETGSQWHYGIWTTQIPYSGYQHFESTGDTTIAGKTCFKITEIDYRKDIPIMYLPAVFVYEQNDTVYIFSKEKNRFVTFYIFNGQKGDTLTLDFIENLPMSSDSQYRVVIDSIDNVEIKQVALKRYIARIIVNDPYYISSFYYMDRIGGMDWFYPQYLPHTPTSGGLRCYEDKQIDTFFFDLKFCKYIGESLNSFNKYNTIKVYPNPVHDKLHIANRDFSAYQIFNTLGEIIDSGLLNGEIDCINLNQGMYLLKIMDKETTYFSRFVKD